MGIKRMADYPSPQAALNDFRNWDILELEGHTKINGPLILPVMKYKTLRGWGMGDPWCASYIEQTADNCPIFQTADELTHTITLKDFGMGWTNQQGPTSPKSMAVMFSIPRPGTGNGWWHWTFDHLKIDKPYIGMGFDPTATGSYAFWGNVGSFVWMTAVQHSALDLVSPTTVGMPVNTFRDLKVFNTDPLASDGPAIRTSAVELAVDGFDLEGWHNRIAYHDGGPSAIYRRLHVEHHTWDRPNDWTMYAANGPVTVEDASFAGKGSPAGAVLFQTENQGSMHLTRVDARGTGLGFTRQAATGGPFYVTNCPGH